MTSAPDPFPDVEQIAKDVVSNATVSQAQAQNGVCSNALQHIHKISPQHIHKISPK